MTNGKNNGGSNLQQIKQAADGQWRTIIPAVTGLDPECFNGKNQPCPGCGGTDRFRSLEDFDQTGAVFCNVGLNGNTVPKSGDGISTVQHLLGCDTAEALRLIARHAVFAMTGYQEDNSDIIGDLCKDKNMPVESAMIYGAVIVKRGRQRVVRFPVYDSAGGQTSHSDISRNPKGKFNKGMLPRGGKQGLHFPGKLPQGGERWLICEGVKDAAALHGLGFDAAGMTGSSMKPEFAKLFTGCDVVIVPDLDRVSMRDAAKYGEALQKTANTVTVAILPGVIKPTGGNDVRDTIAADGADVVLAAIENTRPFDADELKGDRPTVDISIESATEQEIANKVIRHLADHGFVNEDVENRIYQRGGELVIVVQGDAGPRIVKLKKASIRERITAAMDLIVMVEADGAADEKLKPPPVWLSEAIHARPTYQHVRRLDGIVTSPTMRADGSVLQTAGYDSQSRLLYVPDGDYPVVPDHPTQVDAAKAAAEILDVVIDFEFTSDAAKSVWLALVLTLIGRSAVEGRTLFFGFSANCPGTGKGLLLDLAAIITTGRTFSTEDMPATPAEFSKTFSAIAVESPIAVLFDNVDDVIGSKTLDRVLTSNTVNGRILGKTERMGDVPWRSVLMATGNNLAFKGDMNRRVLLCNLKTQSERPEERDGWKHGDVKSYVLSNRQRFAVASLIILRAHVVADRPYEGKVVGSFEPFSEIICGAIVYAGLANPLGTVADVRKQDSSSNSLLLIMDGLEILAGKDGMKSRDIVSGIESEVVYGNATYNEKLGWDSLRAAFEEMTDKKITTSFVSGILRRFFERSCDGRRIVKKKGRANAMLWSVEKIETIEAHSNPGNSVQHVGNTSVDPFEPEPQREISDPLKRLATGCV